MSGNEDQKPSLISSSDTETNGEVEAREVPFTFIRSSEEPDITIIVGDIEFREYRQTLRCWSDYFDAAFWSGMKENTTKTFRFPDRDPEEWRLIMSLTAPFATERITKDNVYTALSWYDELCSPRGLKTCDTVMRSEVISVLLPASEVLKKASQSKKVGEVLNTLATSIQYDLQQSKAACFGIICRFLEEAPHLLEFEHVTRIVSFLESHEECRSELWDSMEASYGILWKRMYPRQSPTKV